MGLPITASYVILAIFSVGALTQFGVPSMTAHMISYWLAVVSAVTPPVALAAYAASAIAQSDPVKTGNQAVVLSSMIFLTPFLFVYTPILLTGSTVDITITIVGCVVGVVAWAIFIEGYGLRATTPVERVLAGVGAAILLLPVDRMFDFFLGLDHKLFRESYALGGVLVTTAFVMQLSGRLRRTV
jgi:TRAP-type uncharacterized transport system fused permease subunit